MAQPKIRVALYARQSLTRDERSASIDTQLEDLRALAERHGWRLVGEYVDRDAPADALERREAWLDLLETAEAGGLDVVAAYDTSRLWRSVEMKLATYKQLHAAGVSTVATLAGESSTDPDANPEDGFMSTILAAVNELDNRMRAAKIRRSREHAASTGQPHPGPRAFGWLPGNLETDPAEAAMIRKAASDVLAGRSMRSIADEWNRVGVTTSRGRPWNVNSVRDLLTGPRMVGLRVHRGEVVGKGAWEPILDRATWERICAVTAGRRRGSGRPPTRLLSGIAVCALCEQPMRSSVSRGTAIYACRRLPGTRNCGRLSIVAEALDAEIRDQCIPVLAGPGLAKALQAGEEGDRSADLAAQLAADEAALEQLTTDHYVDRLIARREYLQARQRLEARIRKTREALAASANGSILRTLPEGEGALRAWWDVAGPEERRTVVETLIVRVLVQPGDPKQGRGGVVGRRFDPERIVEGVEWRF